MDIDIIENFLESLGYKKMNIDSDDTKIFFFKKYKPYAANVIGHIMIEKDKGTFNFISKVKGFDIALNSLKIEEYLEPKFVEQFNEMEDLFKYALMKIYF